MKKYLVLFLVIFIFSFFIKKDKYIELNDLKIIDRITIKCNKIILREAIPIRDDNGIEYKYKYYKINNLNSINNNYYTKRAKIINKCKK